jgi:cytochrome c-type biogenesis protein CcmH/NrfG
MKKFLSLLKEKIAGIIAELVRKGDKSPAAEEAPLRSPSELKILAEVLKGTIEKNPTDLKALYNLGEVYMKMHRYGDAISPLRELVKVDPEHKSGRL